MHIKYCDYEVGYVVKKIKKTEYDAEPSMIEKWLWTLGEQGYELVDLHDAQYPGGDNYYVLTFKRIYEYHDRK